MKYLKMFLVLVLAAPIAAWLLFAGTIAVYVSISENDPDAFVVGGFFLILSCLLIGLMYKVLP